MFLFIQQIDQSRYNFSLVLFMFILLLIPIFTCCIDFRVALPDPMWPSNSNWPKWPQNMPNTVEETNHWAELARQWAAANTPPQPPPAQQLPPPPPPPPPPPVEPIKLEDQDDRILVPLVPFDDNSSSMHYNSGFFVRAPYYNT